ncbi:hypothetical protein ACJMK2_020125 [Sinanodonta woodiana]|uniref:Uncharacterized protein n=1 Tax=Sinanodonta woodiana TaxID=1069815 RepID=A0ABD3TYE0_SINWO
MPRSKRPRSPDMDEGRPPTATNRSGQTPKCPRSAYKKRDREWTCDACDSRVKTVTTGCQTILRPKKKSARTQYSGPRKVDKDEPWHTTATLEDLNTSLITESSEITVNFSDSMDSSYAATSSKNSSRQSSFNEDQGSSQENKFLVAESALLRIINHRMGTFINIVQKCDFCSHKRSWNSQPFVGSIPAGNLLLSAAILFAGAIPSEAMRIFEFLKMVLPPAMNYTFLEAKKQEGYFEEVRLGGDSIVVAGDGRADSPGHSAKYVIYSTVDVNTGKVVNMEIVQSNEVLSSYHMELEGLKRTNDMLQENGIKMESIITDRHTQVTKWVKENLSDCTHYYDIWHCAKGKYVSFL